MHRCSTSSGPREERDENPVETPTKEVPTPGYQAISLIAASLKTDEKTLLDFRRKGWIEAVERGNTVFLSAAERYRAKYILHLIQTKRLSDNQVHLVLSVQRPPYSAAEVDRILEQHAVDKGEGGG